METSLQGANLTADNLQQSLELTHGSAEELAAEEHHIHLPGPSIWPFILSVAILVTIVGLLSIPDAPYLAIIGAVFVLISILGWGLEDPMASPHAAAETAYYGPITSETAHEVLEQAEEIVDRTVTVSSTAWSTHPVRVELESEDEKGIVLAVYGKVELEAQRTEVEEALRQLPYVVNVRNFIVAEDSILETANKRIANLQSQGKLEGATNISVLVENYILHIYGDVPNRDMKYLLERELIGIPGVRVIVNHIGLNKEIPGNLGKTRNA
jgi:hypothetical protein